MAPPGNQGIGQTNVIEMGPDYSNQFFYSLESNTVISSNSRLAYDLVFDCGTYKFTIWLNTAKFMSLVRTDKTDLASVSINDTVGKHWYYELGEFNIDSNSFGTWWDSLGSQPQSAGKVYIINLGYDDLGNFLGFVKLKVNDFYNNSYSISFSALGSADSITRTIDKDDTHNYKYFSFTTQHTVESIEPGKSAWDLCFTRYSVLFYDPYYLPYEVTGVLSNPSKVSAYMDSTLNFPDIGLGDFNIGRLQSRRDAIGFEWKRYSGFTTNGNYTTNTWYTYYIKAGDDRLYKLHFLDFYRNGVKGYPTFEYFSL